MATSRLSVVWKGWLLDKKHLIGFSKGPRARIRVRNEALKGRYKQ
jgi:hypothetical protein